jgi:hypothetical protein
MAQEETGIQRAVIKGGEVRIQNGGERQRADGHANFSFVAKRSQLSWESIMRLPTCSPSTLEVILYAPRM